jgi:hypothetical protein|tara:strand:+ start:2316 stop:2504 length:189 start_codon:yes stop_codon:yes gene_type:complete
MTEEFIQTCDKCGVVHDAAKSSDELGGYRDSKLWPEMVPGDRICDRCVRERFNVFAEQKSKQ